MIRISEPVFIDANVLIYSVGSKHSLRQPSLTILEAIEKQQITAYTSSEVLQEVMHYLSTKPNFANIMALILALPMKVLPVGETEIRLAFDLMTGNRGKVDTRDVVHAATMIAAGINIIVSADKHFDSVKAVKRIDLAEFS